MQPEEIQNKEEITTTEQVSKTEPVESEVKAESVSEPIEEVIESEPVVVPAENVSVEVESPLESEIAKEEEIIKNIPEITPETVTAQSVEPLENKPQEPQKQEEEIELEKTPEIKTIESKTETQQTEEIKPAVTESSGEAKPAESVSTEVDKPEPKPEPVEIKPVTVIRSTRSKARELLVKARNMIQFKKRKKLDKVMTLFAKQTKITNDEVEKFLHVSDATATRYLSQLEKEGKIKQQNGKTGKWVSYSKI